MELAMQMTQAVQAIQTAQKIQAQKKEDRQEEKLLEEIREIKRDIACNEGWFSVELDEDLIEACVYQGQALRARYRYLMRRARTEHVCARLFEAES